MTHLYSAQLCRRWLAGFLAVMVGLGPLATPAYAALTLLADQPLNAQNKAQPNIMLTIDDSTSMLFDFLPDNVIQAYCRDIDGRMTANCGFVGQNTNLGVNHGKYITPGYIYQQFGMPFPAVDSQYGNSGPGAGCFTGSIPLATCFGGTPPGPLPGLERYPNPAGPPPPKSPFAGQEYAYWTLWPAPAHNSAFNHIYYNPKLTYSPPVFADGTSYPQMTDWKNVPADPWASTVQLVDLTTPVTVGIWCNSDWSQGHENDPAYCRTNGTGPSAATSSAATVDGEYNYPWAPPGIAPGNGPTIAKSIAWSKVDPMASYAILPAWATAQDPKYFYQNDNVLWCNSSDPRYPKTGPVLAQTCTNPPPGSTPQVCVGDTSQTCGGGTPQSCDGIQTQTCNGKQTQTCGALSTQVCNLAIAAHCNAPVPQTCDGVGDQTCSPVPQSCDGVTPQSCGGIHSQSCNNVRPQSCNLVAGICIPPDPSTCTDDWVPAGCNTCAKPGECPGCTLVTSCPDGTCNNAAQSCTLNTDCPVNGSCNITGSPCSSTCPTLPGNCAADTGISCFDASVCPDAGQCTADFTTCHSPLRPGECLTIDGQCSGTHAACSTPGLGVCPAAGTCSIHTGTACYVAGTDTAECPQLNGTCTITHKPCFDGGACPSTGTCDGTAGTLCSIDADCPNIPGACSIDFHACAVSTDCGDASHCSINTGVACHVAGVDPAECPDLDGACDIEGQACNDVTKFCPLHAGHCHDDGNSCTAQNCPSSGMTCSSDGRSCTLDAYCPLLGGTCSLDSSPCIHVFNPPFQNYDYCNPITTAGNCSLTPQAGGCMVNADCPGVETGGPVQCSDVLGGSTTLTIPVPNGNFEAFIPLQPGNYSYGIGGGAWSYTPGIGIQHYVSTALNSPPLSGDGVQTAFIQGPASMWQFLAMPAGSYRITFVAAQRSYSAPPGAQPISVSIDDVPIAAPITPTPDFAFNTYTLQFTILTGGSHKLSFSGTVPGDRTTFIDAISITSGLSLLEDANGAGVVCRHNNQAYGGTAAARYNYPDATFNTPVFAGTGPNACVASPRYANIPRHYWKTSVEWCIDAESHPDAKWQGFGTTRCQANQDDTHIYPRFYQFDQPAGTDNLAIPAFQRIDLDVTKPAAIFDHGLDELGDPIIRTFAGTTPDASEMVNYANWYAYYRTRILAVKSVTSLAFKELDGKSRVGLHTMFADLTPVAPAPKVYPVFLDIAQFDDAAAIHQKSTWFARMFGIKIPLGHETPTLNSMVRIGEYYKSGPQASLVGSTDPIVLSCSKNFHLLFTDGYTNQDAAPTDVIVGNQDNVIPDYTTTGAPLITSLPVGGTWPHPFQENFPVGSANNSLSDYAMYYWVTDLYHGSGGPRSFNVVASDPPGDPATWLHQNFAAVSLGTTGKLAAGTATEHDLQSGVAKWPLPYPNVWQPDNSGVDDLWHAAINGRAQFVNAQSVEDLKLGIGQVLADVAAQTGSRAGAGFQSVNYSKAAGTNVYYKVTFNPGWAGSLTKVTYDPTLPAPPVDIWKASSQLTAQLTVGAPPDDQPWFTHRKIVTVDEGGVPVPFLWNKIGPHQLDSMWPPNVFSKLAREKAMIEYLRGNSANEGASLGQFRKRSGPLGDIVNSSPVYVGPPNSPYRDSDDPGYSAFRTGLVRDARVYAVANDGMVHAFDDATGNETWAYIPSQLFRGGTAGGDPKAGLSALAYQTGALPPFVHHFLVDGPLKIGDVDFGGANWHTIAVGGLGKGGKMYYGLDVTQPSDIITEQDAANKVMWEFTDPDMGYSYGKPMLAKIRAYPDGWVVIVASGYNNPSGIGKLFIFDAKTGGQLFKKTLSTGVGVPGSPSGLAHPAGYTKDFRNQTVEQIYAGDLLGNFWRFDVSDPVVGNWTMGLMARLVDDSNNPQPVTTPPQIEVDVSNGIDRWVFVGTGKLYDDSDLTDLQQQTMYAFRDNTADAPGPIPVPPLDRFNPGMKKLSQTSADDFGLGIKPDKGWFDDLPAGVALGQRIVVPFQAALSILVYVGTSPQQDPCLTGQQANVYVRDYSTGQSLLTQSDGVTVERSEPVAEGAVGVEIVSLDPAAGTTTPDIRVAFTIGTTGIVKFLKPKFAGLTPGHRMSWRLLGQ